jgi:general secretion pathway protein D
LPFLSQLEVLGPLFGLRGTAADRTELLIMLTPRVIADTGEAAALAEELRAKLGSLAPELARGLERPRAADRLAPPRRRAPSLDP